jgi:hypothetical protein
LRPRAVVAALSLLTAVTFAAQPRFFPDDPLWNDDDRAFDASKAAEQEDSNGYDFTVNSFFSPGERRDVRAMNVNTLDEVPDSSWFTNRIGRREIPMADLVRGPDQHESTISLDGWVVSGPKGSGVQPGFRMRDPAGQLYQIEVDPPANPEMATGAEIIGTAFYYAIGYYTVEVYLSEVDAASLVIADSARIRDPGGRQRAFTRRDLDLVFRRAARKADGRYRVLVSKFAPGRPLGNFRYHGTRSDDPNDVVPHEHRRELRGARVFGAWLNHDDSRGVNSLDMLEPREGGGGYIKHYMFDFGSILGSGTVFAQRHRAGNEYIFEQAPGWKSLATLGLYVRPWMLIDYPDVPTSIGRFEGDAFDPAAWKPEYPNPAFDNMRPDDAFWAARIVARFSDAAIRAIVEKARYSDPRATDYMTETLIKRRDKVVSHWLNGVNPVVDLSLDSSGQLTWGNAAVAAGVAEPPASYIVKWFRFDNAADTRADVGDAETVSAAAATAPAALRQATPGEYIGVEIRATHATHPAWAKPATFYFRRAADSWTWVGAERE